MSVRSTTMHRSAVIHGDNVFKSREKLGEYIDWFSQQTSSSQTAIYSIIRLEATKITSQDLEQAFLSNSLFTGPELIIIEGLHSLPTSQRKKDLLKMSITFLESNASSEAKTTNINTGNPSFKQLILWEKRLLTNTMLKPFSKVAEIHEFKLSSVLFSWLDSLSPQAQSKKQQLKLLAQVKNQESEFVAFSMLTRQIRLLIQAKNGEKMKAAPFIITKLKKQSALFTSKQLLDIHTQLAAIDISLKTSKNYVSLSQELDLLIAKI